MNPRRPTPSGPEPDIGAKPLLPQESPSNHKDKGVLKQRLGIALSQRLLSEFLDWCRGHSSEETCRQYMRKLKEIDRGEKPVEHSRWHITAYKKLTRYLCEEKRNERACREFKTVKSRRSEPELYVPSEDEVRRALESPLGWFYGLLLESGLRASEVARVLEGGLRRVDRPGFTRYELNWKRGAKRAYWAYFLRPVEGRTPGPVDLRALEKAREAQGTLGFKYLRKFVATKLVELGCGQLEIDFIQGRAPRSILEASYAQVLVAADRCYERYAAWLREWLPS